MMVETNWGQRPFKTFRQGISLLLLGLLLGAVCFGVGFFTGGQGEEEGPRLSEVTVEHQLQQISQLALTRYAYTSMGQFQDHNDFYGIQIPFTGKRFIVSYDGVIVAGIDLAQAKVNVSPQEIVITLPPAQILSHEIDPQSLEIFDESKNIFNPITIQDYHKFHAEQRGKLEQKALSMGLLPQAEQQAQMVVYGLIAPMLQENQVLTVTIGTA